MRIDVACTSKISCRVGVGPTFSGTVVGAAITIKEGWGGRLPSPSRREGGGSEDALHGFIDSDNTSNIS